MCELTFISRALDGLILCETWEDSSYASSSSLSSSSAYSSVKSASSKNLPLLKKQAKELLKRVDDKINGKKCSVDSGQFVFHYMVYDGICYMTMCHSSYPKKLAFLFLEEIQKLFLEELKKEYGQLSLPDYMYKIQTIEKPYSFIKFDRIIQRKRQEYRDPSSNKAMQRLNENLMEVSSIMRKNIDDIIQRGDNLEDVGRKANDLKYASKQFLSISKVLSFQALMQQYAPFIVVGGVALIIFAIYYFL